MKKQLAGILAGVLVFQAAFATAGASGLPQQNIKENTVKQTEVDTDMAVDLEDPGYYKYLEQTQRTFRTGNFAGKAKVQTSALVTNWGGSSFYHNERYQDGYEIVPGIDVSKWNGDINWDKVKKSGVQYVFIRLGYSGTSTGKMCMDPYYKKHLAGAQKAGLKVGVYYFSQAVTVEEAGKEAEYVLKNLGTKTLEMPVVFDYEYSPGGRLTPDNPKGVQAKTACCEAFCDVIEKAGFETMVYANKSMLETNLNADSLAQDNLIWLAHYTSGGGVSAYKGEYQFWQCSDTAKVSGISGSTDLDYWYRPVDSPEKPGDGTDNTDPEESEPEAIKVSVPRGIKQTASSTSSVQLSWADQKDADGYEIYRSSSPNGSYKKLAEVSAKTLKYTDKKLAEGRAYYYKLKAYKKNTKGQAVYSSASSTYEMQTKVSNPVYVQTKKPAYMRTLPGTDYGKKVSSAIPKNQAFSVICKSYDRSGNVWFKVKYKKGSKSYTGYVRSGDLRYYVPSVSGLKETSHSTSKIAMSWKKTSSADGYEIYRSTAYNGSYKKIKTISSGSTVKYTDTKLSAGREYFYKIRAYNVINGRKYYSSLSSYKTMHAKAKKSFYVKTTANVVMRKGGGTSAAKILTVPKNKKLKVTYTTKDKKGAAWYKISYKKGKKIYTGYIISRYAKKA